MSDSLAKIKGRAVLSIHLNRKTTEELAEILMANGIKAVAYHAGIDSKIRAERQDQFLNEDVQVIVATIAFGWALINRISGLLFIIIFRKHRKLLPGNRSCRKRWTGREMYFILFA